MKPTGKLPADADDFIRHRAHAAHDQLRLYFSLRVLSEALPTRRRLVNRRTAALLAVGLAAAVAVVGLAFGSHLAPAPTQNPGPAPAPVVNTPTPLMPDAITSGVLSRRRERSGV